MLPEDLVGLELMFKSNVNLIVLIKNFSRILRIKEIYVDQPISSIPSPCPDFSLTHPRKLHLGRSDTLFMKLRTTTFPGSRDLTSLIFL